MNVHSCVRFRVCQCSEGHRGTSNGVAQFAGGPREMRPGKSLGKRGERCGGLGVCLCLCVCALNVLLII